ncbi:MAG: hypothetical protein RL168_764 [Bacteroidota bacterium]
MRMNSLRALFLGVVLLVVVSADDHPLHLSSATLVQAAKNHWVVKKTIYTDDFEEALARTTKEKVRLQAVSNFGTTVADYLSKNVHVTQGKKPKALPIRVAMAYAYSPESIEVTFEFDAKPPFTLEDTSLMELFDDQKNVYAVRKTADGYSQHALLQGDQTSFTIQ